MYYNRYFVLKSTGGLSQPEWSPCTKIEHWNSGFAINKNVSPCTVTRKSIRKNCDCSTAVSIHITPKWFGLTIKGYLSRIPPNFDSLISTRLGSGTCATWPTRICSAFLKITDFLVILSSNLTKIGLVVGGNHVHKSPKFREDWTMYVNLTPKSPGHRAPFWQNLPPDRIWKHSWNAERPGDGQILRQLREWATKKLVGIKSLYLVWK